MADDVVVDLPAAEDEPAHVVGFVEVSAIIGSNEPLARSLSVDVAERTRRRPFGRHDHERPRGGVERLPTEQVEVLRGRRAVGDADVFLCGELEEALEPRARMLRPVPLVPVREKQGRAVKSGPTSSGPRR